MGANEDSNESESGEESSNSKSEETLDQSVEENKQEDKKEEKADVESLRKVIKVGEDKTKEEQKETADEKPKEEKKKETERKAEPTSDEEPGNLSKESLEQKRAILQNIKDFDFQIKKNHEDIDGINQRLDNLTKDLDDIVSLYEIVSEQMNPFVGISNVTKKRLDALENFTKEIDLLKERTAELESFAERSGARLKKISEGEVSADTIDPDAILGENDEEEGTNNNFEKPDEETGLEKGIDTGETVYNDPEKMESITYTTQYLSDSELDEIIETAFLSLDGRIDNIINEFIESLKG
jgi:flagellar protein FlaC